MSRRPAGAPTRGFILAAGYGTRLAPLSDRLPKPVWPLFGRPLIGHALRALARAGVREAIVNLHHLPAAMEAVARAETPAGMTLHTSYEETILGTGGPLKVWRDRLGQGPLFLLNGDTYRSFDLTDLARCHETSGAVATLSLAPMDKGAGPIGVDGTGRIVRFLDARAPGGGEEVRGGEFTGVHLLTAPVLDAAAAVAEDFFCINLRVHARLIGEGVRYQGFQDEGYWSDLGTPARYLGAHRDLMARDLLPQDSAGRWVRGEERTPEGGRIIPPVFLGPGATVAAGGVAGPEAVLSAGAAVTPGGTLRRAVALPGARVTGRVENVIYLDETMTLPGDQAGGKETRP